MPFADYVAAAVVEPLGLGLDPHGPPGAGMHATLGDVLAVAAELLEPTVVAGETLAEMTAVQFAGLSGVLPDYGRFDPLDWGLGVQIATPRPAWMGSRVSPRTFGHFGGSGTFLWVDPERRVACAALADCPFGEWAKEAWPALSDAVLDELAAA
jgi:CubicO group peptidase (beta-lactamase class C family)